MMLKTIYNTHDKIIRDQREGCMIKRQLEPRDIAPFTHTRVKVTLEINNESYVGWSIYIHPTYKVRQPLHIKDLTFNFRCIVRTHEVEKGLETKQLVLYKSTNEIMTFNVENCLIESSETKVVYTENKVQEFVSHELNLSLLKENQRITLQRFSKTSPKPHIMLKKAA